MNNITEAHYSVPGTAAYLLSTQSDSAGAYSVAIDNQAAQSIDGYSKGQAATCGVGWSMTGLDNGPHTVVLNLTGQSAQATQDGVSASAFELDGFMYASHLFYNSRVLRS